MNESSKGQKYLAGTINGQKVVAFVNNYKKEDKDPDWKVFESVPREQGAKKEEDANSDVPF